MDSRKNHIKTQTAILSLVVVRAPLSLVVVRLVNVSITEDLRNACLRPSA